MDQIPPDPVAAPPVADPAKPGTTGVRVGQVFAGIGMGAAVSVLLRLAFLPILQATGKDDIQDDLFIVAMWVVPPAIAITLLVMLFRSGRKSLAIGLAVWIGIAGPFVALTGVTALICRGTTF